MFHVEHFWTEPAQDPVAGIHPHKGGAQRSTWNIVPSLPNVGQPCSTYSAKGRTVDRRPSTVK